MTNLKRTYRRLNNLLGWIVGLFASAIYIITSEPTVSFWDCGEYIATAYKLLVGHPPGAPLFQLVGRVFSLLALGDTTLVARMINTMSALSSGFTILFLFWSITILARKIVLVQGELTKGKMFAIFGSALVGSLAYTFSDSFWFSAVEGEVYAMSSFFTAAVFWAILKWEESAEEKASVRWLLLIAFLIGLSIGVHLLNLLTIPAMTFVFYFKRYKNHSWKALLLVSILSLILVGIVMSGIIPWIVKLAGLFELLFVNNIGLPFNTGTVIYFLMLIGGLLWGLHYTRKKKKLLGNTLLLAFSFLLIGYSSFLLLVIRSNADTPIDENNPDNAINLLAYLNREQYGDWPIFYGNYYNAPVTGRKDGNPVYTKDKASGKYIITDSRKGLIPEYDERFMTVFPRMWSSTQAEHETGYKNWARIKGTPIGVSTPEGGSETIYKPTFAENLRFFWRYQMNYMYWRYFLWNFVGRQNDIQGMGYSDSKYGDILHGNWASGIRFIDERRLGPQSNLPENAQNQGKNYFYFLPLLLGLIGVYFHFKAHYKDAIVISFLFFMTGIAIVLYLNQYAPQPRERDYSYAASFYAFAIWIGLGVLGLFTYLDKLLSKRIQPMITAISISLICLVLVPGIMAKGGWDDHDRSGRYSVLQVSSDYLNSCAPNAILFTNGDNDTFPLWYAQEVEGIRTDVRVCNLSLLQTDWYIDQMKRKAYLSEPVPFSLTQKQYRQGSLDIVYFIQNPEVVDTNRYYNLSDLIKFVSSGNPNTKFQSQIGELDYFPTNKFSIPVDKEKVLANGTVPKELAGLVVPSLQWVLDVQGVQKNHLMVLDLLSNFNWDRPVYFSSTIGEDNYLNLQPYFQLEGLAYRLVPVLDTIQRNETGRVNTDIMYTNLMNKFRLRMDNPKIYYNEDHLRMTSNLRNIYGRLAIALLEEGKVDSAVKVVDRCLEIMPDKIIPYNFFVMPFIDVYYQSGNKAKGKKIMERVIELYRQDLEYYFSFRGTKAIQVEREKQIALGVMQRAAQLSEIVGESSTYKKSKELFDKYYQVYIGESSGN
ncbi:MAG: DUF2723 domain-containing protein [Bacteroidales bacterium]